MTVEPEHALEAAGPVRVMLVDDQHLLRMGFRLILEGEDDVEVVGEAADGTEALSMLESLGDSRPDVVLMDVRMPRLDGIEATRRVVESYPDIRIIILTTFDVDEYAFSALQAGASAFLLKDAAPEELVQAVRVVAEGDAVVAPRVTQRLLEVYLRKGGQLPEALTGNASPAQRQGAGSGGAAGGSASSAGTAASPGGPVVPEALPSGESVAAALDDGVVREALTSRETEVLLAVAEGLSNAEIAEKFFLSEATVKTHVRRILTKLHLRDRVQAVVYAFQTGLVVPAS